MRKISIILLIMIPMMLFGALVNNVPMTFTQPDGNEINILASGDEYHHWFHDFDGYTINRNDKGFYVYADKENNKIVATNYIVGQVNPQSVGLERNINISDNEWKAKRDDFYRNRPRSIERTPSTGDLINVVIFIRFSGESEFTSTIDFYDDMMNSTDPELPSVHNYYNEVSYGQINVTADFFPQPDENNVIVSYEDSHPRGYYEAYSNFNQIGYQGGDHGDERSEREQQLLADAAEYVESMIPEDLAIDGDNDGYVDNVIYVIKGSPNNWASLLWPHRWSMYYATAYIHGKQVYDYNFQIETHLNSSGSSVMCHELYHSLGAPDLYRYDTDGDPVGVWDLMAGNTTPPQHMNQYMKYYYTQWMPNIPKIEESGTYTLYPVSSNENNVYKITSWNYLEDIYFEYRRIDPLFESALPSQGLLTYKINNSEAGNGNAGGPPDEVYIYRPGGNPSGGGQIGSAPLNSYNDSFGFSTNPQAIGTNGNFTGVDVHHVQVFEDSLTFKVDVSNIIITSLNNGESLIANGLVDIEWIAKNNVSNINLEYSVDDGASWITIIETNANQDDYTWQVPELNSDSVLLRAYEVATGKYDVINNPLTVVSELAIPAQVAPINEAVNVATNPLFSWDQVIGAYEYELLVASSSEFNSEDMFTVTVSENMYDDIALADNQTYYWKVKAINGPLESEYSEVFSFETGDYTSAPDVPSLISPAYNATMINPQEVDFEWSNSLAAQDYLFQLCPNIYFYDDVEETQLTGNSISVEDLLPQHRYYWRVKANNSFGESSWSSINTFFTAQAVSNEVDNDLLKSNLIGNYPNPFNPETTISFVVGNENSRSPQAVVGRIYNVKGQLVKTLINDKLEPNKYQYVWKGKDNKGNNVASGIYYFRLDIASKTQTSKMLLLK